MENSSQKKVEGAQEIEIDGLCPFSVAKSKYRLFPDVDSAKGLRVGDLMISRSGNIRFVTSANLVHIKFLAWLGDGSVELQECNQRRIATQKLIGILRRIDSQPLFSFKQLLRTIDDSSRVSSNVQTLLDFCSNVQTKRKVSLLYDEHNLIARGLRKVDNLQFRRLDVHLADFLDFEKEFIEKVQLFFGFTHQARHELVCSAIIANEIINSYRYLTLLRRSSLAELAS